LINEEISKRIKDVSRRASAEIKKILEDEFNFIERFNFDGNIEFIKLSEVIKLRARGKSSTYLEIKNGLLTTPIKLGGRCIAWPRHEIYILNAARLSGKSDDEIRQIVEALHIARLD